jgi:hypothetical protein
MLCTGVFELRIEVAKTIHVLFNYCEAAIWGIAAAFVLWRSHKQDSVARLLGRVASLTFIAFGVSDLVETRTGTWYDPWWLFAWKATCVLILVSCLCIHAYRTRRRATR